MDNIKINVDILASKVSDVLQQSVEAIKQRHLDAGQKASGKTLASIRSEVNVRATSIYGTIYGRAPFTDLEVGSGPGMRPSGFYKIILDWMRFKGIKGTPIPYKKQPSDKWKPKYTPEERGDRTLAYFIAKKIEDEGTRRHRIESERQDIYSTVIKDAIERIGNSLMSEFSKEVQHININF